MRKQLNFNSIWTNIRLEIGFDNASTRAKAILMDSHIMAILNEIIRLYFDSEIFDEQSSRKKIEIAKEFHLISNELAENIIVINQIRNKYSHESNIFNIFFLHDIETKITSIPRAQIKLVNISKQTEFERVASDVIMSLHYFYDYSWIRYKNSIEIINDDRRKRIEFITKTDE